MSRIAAIVPTYNRAPLLRECLDSLLGQSRPPDEIIVVDDGSTDGTPAMLDSFGDRVRVLRQKNAGKAAALNAGMQLCQADSVWICDDDDIAAPDGLAHLAAALDADPGLGFVHGDCLQFIDTEKGRELRPPWQVLRPGEDNLLILFMEQMFSCQFAHLVRRSSYERVGPFREDLIRSQDYEMSIRLARCFKSRHVPEVIFYGRQHDGMRGTSAEKIGYDQLLQKTVRYEQLFFRELRSVMGLASFVPQFGRGLAAGLSCRTALLQRACIYAEKGLWDWALDDLEAACDKDPAPPLEDELRLAGTVVRSPLTWNFLLADADHCARLERCAGSGEYGRQIVLALTRPLFYLTKVRLGERRFGTAFAQARLLLRAQGPGAFMRSVLRSVVS